MVLISTITYISDLEKAVDDLEKSLDKFMFLVKV